MDFEKKPLGPESREAVEQPVVAEPAPVAQQPAVVAGKRGRTGKVLVWSLAVLLLAGLGAFGYWQWTEAKNAESQLTSSEQTVANLRAELGKTNATADAPNSTPVAITTQSLADETVKAYKDAASGATYSVRVEKVQGDFASIYMKAQATGAESEMVILKKVGDNLVEIRRINGMPVLSKDTADLLELVYGVDVKTLNITVE